MNRGRWLVLVLGPVPIVLGSLGLSHWMKSERVPLASNSAIVRGQSPALETLPPAVAASTQGRGEDRELQPLATRPISVTADQLADSCQRAAEQLAEQLGAGCQTLVRPPFVIAGDCEQATLERWHRDTLGPASRALGHCYFRTPPSQPISVLLFGGEQSYNRYARQLYGDEGISVYGYYKPGQRTLVMNIATGGGTLVHELTHALIDFDFPHVPPWFNEGLASLHEQCHIRSDESGVDGLVNWRLDGLQRALADGTLRPLASLIGDNDFRGARETINYAQARYFCLYMQEQGVLKAYFHRFRQQHKADPLGYRSVLDVFPDRTWDQLDADFRTWAANLKR